MTAVRVPAAAYAVLQFKAARFSTPGVRHRDGSYTLAVAAELLEHLGSLALGNETLGATIVRVLQSSRAEPTSEFSSIPGDGFQFGSTAPWSPRRGCTTDVVGLTVRKQRGTI